MKYTLNSAYQITLLFIGVLFFIGCHKADPVACATIPSSGKVGVAINFVSCSTDAHHEEWDFGDGTSKITGSSVSHTFTKTGSFTITLTAANADMSVSNIKTGVILINQ